MIFISITQKQTQHSLCRSANKLMLGTPTCLLLVDSEHSELQAVVSEPKLHWHLHASGESEKHCIPSR